MKRTSTLGVLLLASVSLVGCKKGDGSGGGGGGGGGWLIGPSGMMAQVTPAGALGPGYDLGATVDLNAIACRGDAGEAFVVGASGTVLYTDDGGESWTSLATPAANDLRSLATQDGGSVFVAGDHTLLQSTDKGDHWRELGDGTESFVSIATAQRGATTLAVAADGSVWAVAGDHLARRATIAGARAIAISPDGRTVLVGGDAGLQISRDAGASFAPLANAAGKFASVRVDDSGEAIAAGAGGLVANVTAAGTVVEQHVGHSDFHVVHLQTWGDDTALGFLAGEDGQVYLTSDAGWSWTPGPGLHRAVYGADVIGRGHN